MINSRLEEVTILVFEKASSWEYSTKKCLYLGKKLPEWDSLLTNGIQTE